MCSQALQHPRARAHRHSLPSLAPSRATRAHHLFQRVGCRRFHYFLAEGHENSQHRQFIRGLHGNCYCGLWYPRCTNRHVFDATLTAAPFIATGGCPDSLGRIVDAALFRRTIPERCSVATALFSFLADDCHVASVRDIPHAGESCLVWDNLLCRPLWGTRRSANHKSQHCHLPHCCFCTGPSKHGNGGVAARDSQRRSSLPQRQGRRYPTVGGQDGVGFGVIPWVRLHAGYPRRTRCIATG
mmetsp:Transcript_45874/g.98016  ORF Transcript_45874/g.98016 Transcript_45874/m.98016 type:complete len:242 (+) Transcript_45874:936-1661(+)